MTMPEKGVPWENNGPMLRQRRMFGLLLQSNPNYFGNAVGSHLPARCSTTCNAYYEYLSCIGYDPLERCLAAIIGLRRANGYGAGTHVSSAPEHVRFYLSFDEGCSWIDQGCASVNVRDADTVAERHAAVSLVLPAEKADFSAACVRLRAILSWNQMPPPEAPDWSPVFGDVLEKDLSESRAQSPAGPQGVAGRVDMVLGAVGLADDDMLVAVVHLKGSGRYSGNARVHFWLDAEGNGDFRTCLGVADLPMHSFGNLSPGVVDRIVTLPVSLDEYRLDCADNSRVLRVMAVLADSRLAAPASIFCNDVASACKGANITLAPHINALGGTLALIGGVPVATADAGILNLHDMRSTQDGILIQGVPVRGYGYLVEVSADGVHWEALTLPFKVRDVHGRVSCHHPDAQTGLFDYLPTEKNMSGVLACWKVMGVGRWQIRLRNFFAGQLLPDTHRVCVSLDVTSGLDDEAKQPLTHDRNGLEYRTLEDVSPPKTAWQSLAFQA